MGIEHYLKKRSNARILRILLLVSLYAVIPMDDYSEGESTRQNN